MSSRSGVLAILRLAALAGIMVLGAGCTGATVRSGVGDRFFERPPYYAGNGLSAGRIGHLPITYQRGASHASHLDPRGGAGSAINALLAEMNAYLDELGVTTALSPAERMVGTPPDVHFGCVTDATGECLIEGEGVPVDVKPRMRLAVGRPSQSWVGWSRSGIDRDQVTGVLVVTLEVGQYWPRQRNLRGQKVVDLGTANSVPLPWLTSLETPVTVLQLTGAVVDRDGRALRIGAEGMLARRTSLLLSSVGGQALIEDEDVERLRTRRRDDLPGSPLAWQAALRNLVVGLARGQVAVSE